MRSLKKSISLLLVVIMSTFLFLVSCGKKQQADSEKQGGNQEVMEITWMNYVDLATNNSYVTKKLPEVLKKKGYNVNIKVKELGTHGGEWGTKFQMLVASGEKPSDVMQLGGLNSDAIKAGWFAELNMDLLNRTIPKYVAQVNKIYSGMWAFGKNPVDGKLYGITSFNMFGPCRHAFVYRGDWLKKLGMDVPQTLDDFEKWLRAVREKDPNGNGKKDEYGYTSGTDSAGLGFSEVFGAFGVMPGQWMIKDGKVIKAEITPEAKEGLALLRKWYSEDLIPKGVMTTAKSENDFYAGLVGTLGQAKGYAPALVPTGAVYSKLKAQQPEGELLPAPSFKGPKGDWGTWEWGPKKYVITFGKHLEKDTKKLETILKMLETIATDKELFELAMLGEKGTHWDFVDANANKGATKFLNGYTEFEKRLNEVGVREMSESAFCPIWVEEIYKDYLDPKAVEYANINNKNNKYYDPLLGISTVSSPQYSGDLDTLSKSVYLEIIVGKKPLEYFDEYVSIWKQKGGDILTKEAQELYDKNFK